MTEYVRIDMEDYAALYVDGELKMWNDAYLVDEYLFFDVLRGTTLDSSPYYAYEDFQMPKSLDEYKRILEESDD